MIVANSILFVYWYGRETYILECHSSLTRAVGPRALGRHSGEDQSDWFQCYFRVCSLASHLFTGKSSFPHFSAFSRALRILSQGTRKPSAWRTPFHRFPSARTLVQVSYADQVSGLYSGPGSVSLPSYISTSSTNIHTNILGSSHN